MPTSSRRTALHVMHSVGAGFYPARPYKMLRRAGCPHPADNHRTLCKKHVIAKPVLTLAVAIRTLLKSLPCVREAGTAKP